MEEAGSRSEHGAGTSLKRMPLRSVIMQTGVRKGLLQRVKSSGSGVCVLMSWGAVFKKKNLKNLSLTPPSPSLPHPHCRQRDEENRIRDSEEDPSLQPPSVTSSRGCRCAQTRYNYDTQGRKLPKLTSKCAVYW